MKYDSQKIVDAIRTAAQASLKFRTVEDGGTCNFDCAYLRVPRMREEQAAEIQQLSGFSVSLLVSRNHGRILKILGIGEGQGNRNTQMCEAAYRSLLAAGFDAGMWYQMD